MIIVTPKRPMDKALRERIADVHREQEQLRRQVETQDAEYARAWRESVEREFRLSPDHVRLLKAMEFNLVEGTDIASIAASGKRPFGNGDWREDIFDILGWTKEYDAEGLTATCDQRACRIMAELPLALNLIIDRFAS